TGTTKGDTWHFKTTEITLGTPIDKVYRKKLVALADDTFWYEDSNHELVSLGNLKIGEDGGLDLTKPVSMVTAYQKVFIINGSVKKIVDFSNTRLTVSSMSHIPVRGGLLSQINGALMVIDFVDNDNKYIYGFVTNGTFAAGSDACVTEDGTGYDYSVTAVRAAQDEPAVYDWTVYPHDDDTSSVKVNGTMPDEPTIITLYRGKIILSGDPNSPHVIYMSEMANPFNFSYGGDSQISASAISGGYVGEIGDVITAVIPYKDDYAIIGCSQAMWLLRGDPVAGGSIDQISFSTGLFDKTSYTWDSEGNLYFLDSNGIYVLPAGFGAVNNISKDILPDFVDDTALTPDVHRVTMTYDRQKHGILICKTDVDNGNNQNFWFDLRTGGLFPEEYPADCSVYSSSYYPADEPQYRKLFLGCRDGFIRSFDTALAKDQTRDSEQAINSYMLIGPGQIASEDTQSLLTQLIFVLSNDSDTIDYELYTSLVAESAVVNAQDDNVPAQFIGTISGGISFTIRPRIRGSFLILKLSNNALDETWAFEKITGQLVYAGIAK
ncbi:MAG TPA: hypothetical protein PLP05_12315, partial [Sedimentisphaerales bacterium]|nr:hypothetical protein [Sedimentisphaerales bacterium]